MIVIVAVVATEPVPAAVDCVLIVPARPTTEAVWEVSETVVVAVVSTVNVLVALSTTVYVPLRTALSPENDATTTLVPTA